MKGLSHPNIIQLVDSFIENGVSVQNLGNKFLEKQAQFLHIIMEYAENGDVYNVIIESE